jgi:pilus assembly protein CpaB
MRPKSFILLMLALGCGIVASIGITQVMAKRGTDPAAPELETVVVAAADIPMGDPIAAQLLKLEEWPKDKIPKGALKSLEETENRRPKSRIFAGSPLMDNQLLGKGVLDQGASDAIPKGMRVVAVKVDLVSGNASLIRPGDRVDVLVHLNRSGGDLSKTVTKTILQDIKVFAVDNVWDAATGSGEKAIVAKTISVLVTPSQAEQVTLACEMGNVRLVMRSPDDKDQPKVPGAVAMDVLGGGGGGGADRILGSFLPVLPTAKSGPSPMSGLLGLLSRSKKPKPASGEATPSVPQPKKSEVFTVRILSESQPMETVLELTGDGKSVGTDPSFLRWRPSSSASATPAPSSSSPEPTATGDKAEPTATGDEPKPTATTDSPKPTAAADGKPAQASPPDEPEDEPDESDEPAADPEK